MMRMGKGWIISQDRTWRKTSGGSWARASIWVLIFLIITLLQPWPQRNTHKSEKIQSHRNDTQSHSVLKNDGKETHTTTTRQKKTTLVKRLGAMYRIMLFCAQGPIFFSAHGPWPMTKLKPCDLQERAPVFNFQDLQHIYSSPDLNYWPWPSLTNCCYF